MYYAKVVFKSEYDFNANVFVISSTDLHVKVTIISSIIWSLGGMVRDLIVTI